VEKRPNRVAMCLERVIALARECLEDFCMYTHYVCVGAIPT